MPPNNVRFLLLGEVLRRLDAGGDGVAPAAWACAYSIDLSDVDVMRAPPCAALAAWQSSSRMAPVLSLSDHGAPSGLHRLACERQPTLGRSGPPLSTRPTSW
eukprot:scaffold17182_cov75-Phaeocystis_antarctica.AAC.4